MGTRARINVYDGNQLIASFYRQFDGYPSGLGTELQENFGDTKIINGFGSEKMGEAANGMGCLAAQIVCHFKEDIGGFYIRSTTAESHGEEYVYNLANQDGDLKLTVLEGSVTWFGNPGDEETNMKSLYTGLLCNFDADELE